MSQQRIVCTGNEAFGLEVRRLVLESFGYRARVLPDCAVTAQSISAERTDLVILDYTELTDGLTECIRQLRAALPKQRILLVAPVPYVETEVATLVDCVLLKGSSPEEFRDAVRACIGNTGNRKLVGLATFIGASLGAAAHLLLKRNKIPMATTSPQYAAEPPARMAGSRPSARSAHS